MKKAEFIKKFSKIEDTFEDEFRAEFNSPELIWEALKEQLTLTDVSQQRELLMREIEKYHNWYTGDNNGKEYAKEYLDSINCG